MYGHLGSFTQQFGGAASLRQPSRPLCFLKSVSSLTLSLFLLIPAACHRSAEDDSVDWPVYLGDAGASHYSPLTQISRDNVDRLEVAWTYRAGESAKSSQIQCNPLIIGDRLYATSPGLKAFCLDAATGKEIWTFDPRQGRDLGSVGVNRGVVYWERDQARRIFYSVGRRFFALDADNGRPVVSFGEEGEVDLRLGLGIDDFEGLSLNSTTPAAVYKDLLIVGTRVGEGPGRAAPGHIRAFDAITGKIRWTFHTIPRPGEPGYETWPPDAWKYTGGANSWAGMTVDHRRGIVFASTGSPTFDFWGGRRKGQNLYGNCVLAIDARTGELRWHFQTVHHDLWDRDLPAPPNLVTVTHDGQEVDAVAQITKWGFVFLLDRETGEPLFPVVETPVPASDLEGEEAWPTQPIPQKPPPFSRQSFTESDVTNISPSSREAVLARFRQIRSSDRFEPPSTQGTLIFPGYDGGGEWGGAASEPSSGLLYVNSNEMPWILTMVSTDEKALPGAEVYKIHCAGCHGSKRLGDAHSNNPPLPVEKIYPREETRDVIRRGKGRMLGLPQLSAQATEAVIDFLAGSDPAKVPTWAVPPPEIRYTFTGYNRFFDLEGNPAIKPPWGQLTAIDLNQGSIVWQVPLGEFEELTQRGIPQTGAENYGGPIVTAGGLLFIGATRDQKFRAFDRESGKVLWETRLPAGGYATPATYSAGGRQYVVIAAGGGKMGTPSGDSYVAFALPHQGKEGK